MTKITLETVVDIAKKVLVKQGNHTAQLIIEDREGKILMLILADMPLGEGKEKLRHAVMNLIKLHGSKRYFVIMETWMSAIKPGEKMFRMPIRDVDRTEALVVSEFTEDKELTRIIPFRREILRNRETLRNKDKIIFEKELPPQTNVSSRWNIWADEDKINKLHDRSVKDIDSAFVRKLVKYLSAKHKEEFFKEETAEGRMKILRKMLGQAKEIFDNQDKTILEDVTKDREEDEG